MDETQPLLSPSITNGSYVFEPQPDVVFDDRIAFNPDGDPDNPMDWPDSYRRGVIFLLAFMAFTV
jgi:hypothetical protein